jgi:hypothetical protein
VGSCDEDGPLVGMSPRRLVGTSATSEHVLPERGFAMVAALFGTPDSQTAKLPDAALQDG